MSTEQLLDLAQRTQTVFERQSHTLSAYQRRLIAHKFADKSLEELYHIAHQLAPVETSIPYCVE
jgi:hypothetical protein